MQCSVAIQFLPMNTTSEPELCAYVDKVIDYIDSTGVKYYVGPFETTIEADLETCMRIIAACPKIGEHAGCTHSMMYVKVDYVSSGDVLSTQKKLAPYEHHNNTASFHIDAQEGSR